MERVAIGDDVIGRQHEQERWLVAGFERPQRGQRDSGRRVTAFGLQQDIAMHLDLLEVLRHQEAMGLVADDDNAVGEVGSVCKTPDRLLQHRVTARERQQLLGVHGA